MLTPQTPKRNFMIKEMKGESTLSFPSSNTLSSLPSSPPSIIPSESMVEDIIENAQSIITKWDPNSSSINKITSLFLTNRKEAKDFLKSVKDLRRAMHFLIAKHASCSKLALAQNLMQVAMHKLEKELYLVLSAYRNQLDPQSVSSRSSEGFSSFEDLDEDGSKEFETNGGERFTAVAMFDLKLITDCMTSFGYGKECVKLYKLSRKSIVDEELYEIGMLKFKSSHINRMNWETQEDMIKAWINAVQLVVKLFSGEKVLCDYVFAASQNIRESCFFDITKDGSTTLFRFPEVISKGKSLPERIFALMDVYKALASLLPQIECIFESESTKCIKLQALTSLNRLGNSIKSTLSNFESSIQKGPSQSSTVAGDIHSLTHKVMSYLSSLADYSGVLSEILAADSQLLENSKSSPFPESYFGSPTTTNDSATQAVSERLAWLILVLLCKLDRKAEQYKVVSLSYLFLANNLLFIVQNVSTTRLKVLLGEDWISSHVKKVKQYASNYELMAWNKVFSSLPAQGSAELPPEEAKQCFLKFNTTFEEAYWKQTSWIVPYGKLRDEIKVSIARKLVPAYRDFYETYVPTLSGQNLTILVRFSPDDLGNYLSDLFHGASITSNVKSSGKLLVGYVNPATMCLLTKA